MITKEILNEILDEVRDYACRSTGGFAANDAIVAFLRGLTKETMRPEELREEVNRGFLSLEGFVEEMRERLNLPKR